jgi:signal transduction histidine kinase
MSRPPAQPRPRRRKRLFWRIYRYGILTLVAVAASATAIFMLLGHQPPWLGVPERTAARLAETCGPLPNDIPRLQAKLEDYHALLQADVAVYTADGTLLASSSGSFQRMSRVDLNELVVHRRRHRAHGVEFALPLHPGAAAGQSAYLIMRWGHKGGGWRLALTLATVMLILGLVSYPLARSVARPLEQLTRMARKLGAGNLGARTGIRRRDEVGLLAATIDEMAARLNHRIRADKELLANVSHELRTPLARIRVALELCAEEDIALEEVQRHLSGIEGDIEELDRLVQDVLTTARLDLSEGKTLAPRPESIDLAALIERATERITQHPPDRTLRVEVDSLPDLQADPVLLHRVLDNLLDNAVLHSEADGNVEVAARQEEHGVMVEVRDRGVGVEENELPHLFEPFFRAQQSRERNQGGTGLGLTLCKRIIEAHGGSLGARLRAGGGMVFWFRLPLEAEAA